MTLETDDTVTGQSILTTATRVPVNRRMQFLPRFLGHDMRAGEALVYDWMQALAPDYGGGYWEFYELSNGGFYMAPELGCETIRIRCPGNFYDATMSPDAAGIVATLYALNASNGKRMETNSLTIGIKDGRARVSVLRGYL